MQAPNLLSMFQSVLDGERQALNELNDVFEENELKRREKILLHIPALEELDYYEYLPPSEDSPMRIEMNQAKQACFEALESFPDIVCIKLYYDGMYDEGGIHEVYCFDINNNNINAPENLLNFVADYVEYYLPVGFEDYIGSCGTVTLDVKKKKLSFKHTARLEYIHNFEVQE